MMVPLQVLELSGYIFTCGTGLQHIAKHLYENKLSFHDVSRGDFAKECPMPTQAIGAPEGGIDPLAACSIRLLHPHSACGMM